MRLDKYLWCVRLFKTRSLATKACNAEHVKINDEVVKASKEVKINDEVSLKEAPIWRKFKVLDFPKSRVGAKLVETLIIETTAEEALKELETVRLMNRENRIDGIVGRPTKRNRRDLDKFKDH